MKFTCPRCLEESVGREYHAACFEAIYREQQILQRAMAERRREAEERTQKVEAKRETSVCMRRGALDLADDKFLNALRASGERFIDALVPKERVWRPIA